MTHTPSHIIITNVKAFLNAPLPGGGKRWHVAVLLVIAWAIGKFV